MQIDRARFLFLTASLAGGGCTPVPPDPAMPVPSAPAPTEPEVVVPEQPEPTDPGSTTTATETETDTETETRPAQPGPGACDNDTGTVPACSISKPPGPYCEGFSEMKSVCKSYKQALRDGIAAKAVACLNAASGTQAICDYSKSEECATSAIRTSCIQPSTFNQCSSVMATCGGQSWSKLSMEDCQHLLSAVKDGKRAAMVTCMIEGCSLESCSWSLR